MRLCVVFWVITVAQALDINNELFANSNILQEWINQTHLKEVILNELKDEPDPYLIYLKMFDASTKIPSGVLFGGSFFSLGNFDECYDIREVNNTYGKYCLGNFPLPGFSLPNQRTILNNHVLHPQPRMVGGMDSASVGYFWAFCVPNTLSLDVLNKNGIFKFRDSLCYSKDTEPSLSTGAILTIITLALFLAISLLSTLYDIYLFYTDKKPHHEMLIAFSYLSNGRKLIKSNNNPDHLLCLNGIRAISMMWVILGHLYSSAPSAPLANFLDVMDWLKDTANMIINGATVSVDTFFAVGGLVTAFTFLNAMDKGHKFNIFMYYLHRFLRLTPAYGIAILVYYNLVPYLGNGPLWDTTVQALSGTCDKSWWSSILYFANIMKEYTCVPQAWYLQADMQLFLLSPLVLIPLVKWKKWAYIELGILTVAGILVPFCLGYFDNVKAPGMQINDIFRYYYATHARFGPYVIGLIAGVLIYNLKKGNITKTINLWIVCSLWIGSLVVLAACVYAGYNFHTTGIDETPEMQDLWANAFFLGFNRNGWALAVCIVIYLCVSGYGGPVNSFLSIPLFQFISKLSYSIYLVHYAVISMSFASSRNNITFSNGAMLKDYWGHFMETLAISVFLCLTFESPILVIEKWIFKRDSSRKTEPQTNGKHMNQEGNNNNI